MTFDPIMRCWSIDLNRPLSEEEQGFAERLSLLTMDQLADLYGWRH